MDPDKQREIARKGGRAAHEKGTAHEFTPDEARAAGRKGGERVSTNRDHMSRIGRLGGKHSAGRRQASRRPEGGNGEGDAAGQTSESESQGSGPVQQEAGSIG
jgi:general stress protein YciG